VKCLVAAFLRAITPRLKQDASSRGYQAMDVYKERRSKSKYAMWNKRKLVKKEDVA
jgi:hypothetical protein